MAGIWQNAAGPEGTLATCAIATTRAAGPVSTIHHRMPVVLEPTDWALWLGEAGRGAARLMQPAGEAVLRFHRAATAVNSNRAQGLL